MEVCLLPIPLYFAADCKEIVTIQNGLNRALTGFGLSADGTLRLPEEIIPALAVIDDAAPCAALPQEETLDALAECCGEGCFFDFLRPSSALHEALLRGIQRRLPQAVPLLVPEAYHDIIPNSVCVASRASPCNNWTEWCRETQRRCPSGWCLELIPWDIRCRCRAIHGERRLPNACCMVSGTHYYDTPETLRQRLFIAQAHGCCAAIGLYRELKALA